jgi:hypothetical protein
MQTATLLRLIENAGSPDDPSQADAFGPMPELPSLNRRWTVRRKAAVIEAVRGGWVPIEEVCRLYKLSLPRASRALPGNTAEDRLRWTPETRQLVKVEPCP